MSDDSKHTQQSIYLKGWYELAKESSDDWTLCYQGWVFTIKKDKLVDLMREQINLLTRERDEARNWAVKMRNSRDRAWAMTGFDRCGIKFPWEDKTDE